MSATAQANLHRFPLVLYKRILRLHYGLPVPELRLMGDAYVKDEFRRHKDAPPEQALLFLKEWTEYCSTLASQLSGKSIAKNRPIGRDLAPDEIDVLEEQKLFQLYELKLEADRWKTGDPTIGHDHLVPAESAEDKKTDSNSASASSAASAASKLAGK